MYLRNKIGIGEDDTNNIEHNSHDLFGRLVDKKQSGERICGGQNPRGFLGHSPDTQIS